MGRRQIRVVGAMLQNEAGRYLIASRSITYLTSGRELLRFGAPAVPPREGPLIVAAPEYNLGTSPSSSSSPPNPGGSRSNVGASSQGDAK